MLLEMFKNGSNELAEVPAAGCVDGPACEVTITEMVIVAIIVAVLLAVIIAGVVVLVQQWRRRRGVTPGVPVWSAGGARFALTTVSAVSMFIGAPVAIFMLMSKVLMPGYLHSDLFRVILAASAQFLSFAVIVGVLWSSRALGQLRFLRRDARRSRLWFAPVAFIGALGFVWPLMILINYFEIGEKQDMVDVIMRNRGDGVFLVFAFLVVCVAAPLTEETFFRGVLYPFLKRVFAGVRILGASERITGIVAASLITGVIFGVLHFNVAAFLPLSLFGAYLCLVYEKNGSLLAPVTVHALFNGLSLLMTACGLE
jgi:membrane protease YdiL (CAAX protease family)